MEGLDVGRWNGWKVRSYITGFSFRHCGRAELSTTEAIDYFEVCFGKVAEKITIRGSYNLLKFKFKQASCSIIPSLINLK